MNIKNTTKNSNNTYKNRLDYFIEIFISYYIHNNKDCKSLSSELQIDFRTVKKYIQSLEYNLDLYTDMYIFSENLNVDQFDFIKNQILKSAINCYHHNDGDLSSLEECSKNCTVKNCIISTSATCTFDNLYDFVIIDRLSFINKSINNNELYILSKIQFIKNTVLDKFEYKKNKSTASILFNLIKNRVNANDAYYFDLQNLQQHQIERYLEKIDRIEDTGLLY